MNNIQPSPANAVKNTRNKIGEIINLLGPGIVTASAAVGGSHLVAATKAGAIYGWQLAGLIMLVNLLKYPFFRASVQYTMGTRKSLVEGYSDMGKGYLWLFTCLCVISSVVNTAAMVLFSASLLNYFIPFNLSLDILSGIVLLTCMAIVLKGHYKALDVLSKIIMAALIIATVAAVIIASHQVIPVSPSFKSPSVWTLASVGFIAITMGWMPAPIEISSFTSMWLQRQCEEKNVTNKSAIFDLNVGYIATAILAIVFLALGALVLHGTNIVFKNSGIAFSHQLISMYALTIGQWSRYLIAIIAFFCIFGSAITIIDGYARVLSEANLLLKKKALNQPAYFTTWMLISCVVAICIILFFASSLMTMLNFGMILSFMTTPIFAFLNYKLVMDTDLPPELCFGWKLKALARIGLIYLFSFLVFFIYWKWFL